MTQLSIEEWCSVFKEQQPEAQARACVKCGHRGCRVGEQDGRPVADVLCSACFESAPHRFKVTCAQDVFRDLVKAGLCFKAAESGALQAARGDWS